MKTIRVAAVVALLAWGAGALTPLASADMPGSVKFMAFSEVRPGMTGMGQTTLDSSGMKTFQIKVVGVVDNPGDLNDYILIRSSGDAINKAGGYAQGMSGSPIYIDGKLVGAFFAAYAFDKSAEPIGFVRPIETMLKLSKMIAASGTETSQLPERSDAWPGVIKASSPLYVSGLSPRAFNWLKDGVNPQILSNLLNGGLLTAEADQAFLKELTSGLESRLGVSLYPMATMTDQSAGAAAQQAAQLAPGRPVGLLFSNGDITLGFVCTTTYIDEETQTLLTCGHQLVAEGQSKMFLSNAQIIDTAQNTQLGFVLPQVDRHQILGSVLEDRFQGVGAALGRTPATVGVTVHLKNADSGEMSEYKANFVDDQTFLASLLFSGLLSAVDQTINRVGEGTMRIDYRIGGDGLPSTLKRSDIFASFSDIAVPGPLQAAQVVFLLSRNEFVAPRFTQIDIDMTVTHQVKALQVRSVKLDKQKYQPGDTIHYTVGLQPFRGAEMKITGSLALPKSLNSRRLVLHVFGGPRRASQSDQNQAPAFESLSELIKAVEGLTTNDRLTVELLGLPRNAPEGNSADEDSSYSDVQHLKDWVVTGEDAEEVTIEPAKTQPQQSQEQKGKEQPKPNCKQLFYC